MNIPTVAPPSAVQLVSGAGVVPQHVPRAEIEAGIPKDVTLAPNVAPVVVMPETVGVITVGTVLAGATVTSVHPLQLFPSFDSEIVPAQAASLSVHVRTEYVPEEGKV